MTVNIIKEHKTPDYRSINQPLNWQGIQDRKATDQYEKVCYRRKWYFVHCHELP